MCICESFILQLHSHVPLNNCFVNFSLNLVCYSHWQPFIFFFSGLLSKAYFQQCSIFLLFLRKINPMCPALISEALVMFFIPLNERLLLLKRTETLPGLDENADPLCWYLLDTIILHGEFVHPI